jgi:hypothetical protein
MLPKYEDILALANAIGRRPLWWDEDGVPRFAPFHPRLLGVYDRYAALGELMCAACGKRMPVGVGRPGITITRDNVTTYDLADVIAVLESFGDPPRHDDERGGSDGNTGCAGETMTSTFTHLIETWVLGNHFQWERNPRL